MPNKAFSHCVCLPVQESPTKIFLCVQNAKCLLLLQKALRNFLLPSVPHKEIQSHHASLPGNTVEYSGQQKALWQLLLSTLLGWTLKDMNTKPLFRLNKVRERKQCSVCAAAWHLNELVIQRGFVRTWQEA